MTVHLVGAGPGDPKLITVRGAELLASADVIVHDRLTAAALLDLAPPDCTLIYVGKDPAGDSVPQDRINEILVENGRTHDTVVRLKGGDPYVFARGAEEAAHLAAAGVNYEVVPGITSALAAPAYGGIPVTRRYSSTSVTIVTGHEDPTKESSDVDWDAIARVRGTIVILMGVGRWNKISQRLVDAGLPADTPAAAVHWGSTPHQQTVRATLDTLGERELAAPSVIVVGSVATEDLNWFEQRPLFGHSVVVTRAKDQASELSTMLRTAGAEVLNVPTIAIAEPVDGGEGLAEAARNVGAYDWVVMTSPNGARRFMAQLSDVRDLAGVKLAVVGPGTAQVLEGLGLRADLIPQRHVGEGLVEEFPPGTGRVLLPRAAVARDVVPSGLEELGWSVDVVEAYRTVPAPVDPTERERVSGADVICFTSSSSAKNFADAFGADAAPPAVVAIGPITAQEARSQGMEVSAVADPHTLEGLVDAVIRTVGTR